MAGYHKNKAGVAAPCKADKKPCPLKGEHYPTRVEAIRGVWEETNPGLTIYPKELSNNEVGSIYARAMRDAFITSEGEAKREYRRFAFMRESQAYASICRSLSREIQQDSPFEDEEATKRVINLLHRRAKTATKLAESWRRPEPGDTAKAPRAEAVYNTYSRHYKDRPEAEKKLRYELWENETTIYNQCSALADLEEYSRNAWPDNPEITEWFEKKNDSLRSTIPTEFRP